MRHLRVAIPAAFARRREWLGGRVLTLLLGTHKRVLICLMKFDYRGSAQWHRTALLRIAAGATDVDQAGTMVLDAPVSEDSDELPELQTSGRSLVDLGHSSRKRS